MAASTNACKILSREKAADGHMQYVVQVEKEGVQAYTIKRRYNDFLTLYNSVKGEMTDLPPMPPKSFFRRLLLPSFLDKRQTQLDELLAAIVRTDIKMEKASAFLSETYSQTPSQNAVFTAVEARVEQVVESVAEGAEAKVPSSVKEKCKDNPQVEKALEKADEMLEEKTSSPAKEEELEKAKEALEAKMPAAMKGQVEKAAEALVK
eukprot:TRINITY_DN2246_c0_g1_i4.p1 TRINITY_DN2246_c0_g1~~TRINITY_DN2246_c0_g1_i4.p1  ORF type:complete len:207 (-),score=91.24 TRINITY_DN2246_c0_g1_i4:289-909(-)